MQCGPASLQPQAQPTPWPKFAARLNDWLLLGAQNLAGWVMCTSLPDVHSPQLLLLQLPGGRCLAASTCRMWPCLSAALTSYLLLQWLRHHCWWSGCSAGRWRAVVGFRCDGRCGVAFGFGGRMRRTTLW